MIWPPTKQKKMNLEIRKLVCNLFNCHNQHSKSMNSIQLQLEEGHI